MMSNKQRNKPEADLNWNNFDWGQFQTLSVRIAEAIFPDCNFNPYLKQGQKQDGLDIISFSRTNGKLIGIQCKREQRLSATDIDRIINEMLAGDYRDKLSNFIVSTSADLQSTGTQRTIQDWKIKLSRTYGITFECWDRQSIESRLKDRWNLVVYYFGRTQADEFCYPQLHHADLDIRDVDDYIPRQVFEFTENNEDADATNILRHWHKKFLHLKDLFLEDRLRTRRICLIGHAHQGKSYYIKNTAFELKQAGLRIQPLLIEVKSHNIQPVETPFNNCIWIMAQHTL